MQLIYGVNPLKEALAQKEALLECLLIQHGVAANALEQAALAKNIPVERKGRDFFLNFFGNANHQGVAGVVRSFEYTPFSAIISATTRLESATLLILDEINDPQNLGALLRVAHCGRIAGVIIPERRACPVTPAVIKTSAGAAFFSKVALVSNLAAAMASLKENGFWIYGAAAEAKLDIADVDFAAKAALVVGSEEKGIRRLVAQSCDVLFSIPMQGEIGSLNVATATSIIVYERIRRMR